MAKETKELSFEENLEKLETIVKKLETGDIPLDDAISSFTEAVTLAKICDEKLKNAEEQVNQILNKDGKLENFQIEE